MQGPSGAGPVGEQEVERDVMSQLIVQVDDQTKIRLDALAQRTGRPVSVFAAEALGLYLDEYEDFFLAKDAFAQFQGSCDEAIELAEVHWPA